MAIIQNRLIGNDRVYRNIQAGTGQRRERHERGKLRKPMSDLFLSVSARRRPGPWQFSC
jgi:hypothetical protein